MLYSFACVSSFFMAGTMKNFRPYDRSQGLLLPPDYANMYDRAIALLSSGKVDLKPLVSKTYDFADSIKAFDRAVQAHPTDVKIQIKLGHA